MFIKCLINNIILKYNIKHNIFRLFETYSGSIDSVYSAEFFMHDEVGWDKMNY